jgi:hypothetical protein
MSTRVRAAAVLASAVVTAAAATLVPVASAVAAPPSTTAIDFDHDVRTIPAGAPFCAFPIERVLDGRLWTRTYTDDAGNLTREQRWVSAFSYTLRNPANGKELTSRLGGTVTTWFGPDGSTRTVIAGNDLNFTQPGNGRLTGYVGRYVEVGQPDGTVTIEMQTPNFADTVFPEVCAALA